MTEPCIVCLPLYKRWEKCEIINFNAAQNVPLDDKAYWFARSRMYGVKKIRVLQDCAIDHVKESDNAT